MSEVLNETRKLFSISIEGGEKNFRGYVIKDTETGKLCGFVYDEANPSGEIEDVRLVIGSVFRNTEGDDGIKLYIAVAAPPNDDVDFFKNVLSIRHCLGNMYGFYTESYNNKLGYLGEWDVFDEHIIPGAELKEKTMAGIRMKPIDADNNYSRNMCASAVEVAHRYNVANGIYHNFFDLFDKSDYSLIELDLM